MKYLKLCCCFFLTSFVFKIASADDYPLSHKIGQLIIVGFRGYDIPDNSDLAISIKKGQVGGIVLFDYDVATRSYERNIVSKEQLKSLIKKLQSLTKKKLFICIDQEGGKVNRLKPSYGFPKFISADSLGKLPLSKTKEHAQQLSKELKYLGINVNFAPVVDINLNPQNPIIGKIGRSFSSDPEKVVHHSRVFTQPLKENNIIFCLKHFPGHGSSKNDSHLDFVDITNTWQEKELLPYKKLFASNDCDMVMVGHLFNRNLDDSLPASLSKKTIQGLLRKTLNYKGLVVTDDLQMQAITKYYSLEKAIELALNAGSDLLIFGNNTKIYLPNIHKSVHAIILKLVREKRVSKWRINNAFEKVMRLKKRL